MSSKQAALRYRLLDDLSDVAISFADWSALAWASDCHRISTTNLADLDAIVERLQPSISSA